MLHFLQILKNIGFLPKKYLSHLFIAISIAITTLAHVFPPFIYYFGLQQISLDIEYLPIIFGKLIFFQFIHGGLLHLFLNSYFLYFAGPQIENQLTRKEFLEFFILGTLFVAGALWIFAPYSITIGISGFCMALLVLNYMMNYRGRYDPQAQHILIMIAINIFIGLDGQISFVGHLSGALWGYIWWYLRRQKRKIFRFI